MDIGQPKDFIIGMGLYLSFLHDNFPEKLEQGENFVGSVLVVSNHTHTHTHTYTHTHTHAARTYKQCTKWALLVGLLT